MNLSRIFNNYSRAMPKYSLLGVRSLPMKMIFLQNNWNFLKGILHLCV